MEGCWSWAADLKPAGSLSGPGRPLVLPLRWTETPAYPSLLPSVSTNIGYMFLGLFYSGPVIGFKFNLRLYGVILVLLLNRLHRNHILPNCQQANKVTCELTCTISSNIHLTHIGSYIMLAVLDHTVLPPVPPCRTLQLQNAPSVAVNLERNIDY